MRLYHTGGNWQRKIHDGALDLTESSTRVIIHWAMHRLWPGGEVSRRILTAAPGHRRVESIIPIQRGLTILLVEQNVFHALRLADRGYVLENGCIVGGSCQE